MYDVVPIRDAHGNVNYVELRREDMRDVGFAWENAMTARVVKHRRSGRHGLGNKSRVEKRTDYRLVFPIHKIGFIRAVGLVQGL